MEKIMYVYNPKSGNGTISTKTNNIIETINNNKDIIIPYMIGASKDDFSDDVIKKIMPDKIIAAGGDGTISKMAGKLKSLGLDDIPIGIIPAGTCNDLARILNLTGSVEHLVDRYAKGSAKQIDIGMVNGRYFLNTFAGGMIAGVSSDTNQEFKKNAGKLAYYLMTLAELGNIKSFDLTVEHDEGKVEGRFIFFLVLNGKHAGGIQNVIPDADINDGYLDVMLIRECNPLDILPLLVEFSQGKHKNNKNIEMFKTKRLYIDGDESVITTIDGERGISLPCRIKCIEKGFNVIL